MPLPIQNEGNDDIEKIAQLKEKSLHYRYVNELEQLDVDIKASQMRLEKTNMCSETEEFMFVIQDQAISTKNCRKHTIGDQVMCSDIFRFYGYFARCVMTN
jgi:hypothetical protein